jgi:dCMP deaminase
MFVTFKERVVETDMNHRDLLRQAYQLARESTDTSTKNGALLVAHTGQILAGGVNSFTDAEQALDPQNYERPRKYKVTEHAERAVIYKAARLGIGTEGLIMVCPWASCPDCARAIVLAGIPLVVGHRQAYNKTPPRWLEEVALGLEILQGGGVTYQMFDGSIGGVVNLFDGEFWMP